MITDRRGRVVWFHPGIDADHALMDLQVQTYRGEPVLTWWEGKVVHGTGRGIAYMADSSYRRISSIRAGNGLTVDLHELNLTPRGTALITAYRPTETDLSAVGGPKRGKVYACQAQEVDIATGKVVFSWDSLDHVPVGDTYQKFSEGSGAPFDYFHINSVSLMPDGDLLISARNTWALYKVSRSTGEVIWRINGKHSDFEMATGTGFYWQHDSRALSASRLTVFDDGASPAEEKQSRGLFLDIDTTNRRVTLAHAYEHPAGLLAQNQGSVQLLPDGQVVIGWGNQPYFSQFTAAGELVLDARFPLDIQSYRACSFPWTGRPKDVPAVVVEPDTTGGATVYVSWNGATEVDHWEVLTGKSDSLLRPVARASWAGLETTITVNASEELVAVVGRDAAGTAIGRSQTVAVHT